MSGGGEKKERKIINLEHILFLIFSVLFLMLPFILAYVIKLRKDIREIKKINNILKQYNKVTKASNICLNSDLEYNITYINDKFCEISQYSKKEVLGKTNNFFAKKIKDKYTNSKGLLKTIKNGKIWQGILKNRKKDGTLYYVNTTISPIFDEDGNIFEYVAVQHEITDLVKKTEELNKILEEDYLTKIGSRYKLIQDIKNRHNPVIALVDVNNFSEINDYFGYRIGDNTLKLVGKTINDLFENSKNYEVYRLTADIFAILGVDVIHDEFIEKVQKVVKKIIEKPFSARGRELYLQLNYSFSFEAKDKLLETANIIRKYSRKHSNEFIYSKNLNIEKDYEKNIFWTQKIKKALEEDGILPYFQAIYNVKTGQIEKYEALMRLNDTGKIISPFFFLDVSKKSGQYLQLTKRMVKKTFEYFKGKDHTFYISINLTFQDISNEITSKYILEAIKEYNFGSRVIIEIVESEEIKSFEIVNDFIKYKMYDLYL